VENEYAYCITGFDRFLQNVMKIPLRSPHFEHVESGLKTVDARIFFPKYYRLHPGDVLKFVNSDTKKSILKKLTSMEPYDNFELLLKTEGVRSCLPNLKDGDVDAGVQLYHSFKANGESYVELEPKYKVIALRLGDVCTIPHRPVTRTNMTDLGQVVIPPSTRSQFLTMTLHVERPTQVTQPTTQPTTVTCHDLQPTPSKTPTTQLDPVPPTPRHISQPTPETLPTPQQPSTTTDNQTDNVVTPQTIQVSPPITPAKSILEAAALVESGGLSHMDACLKLGINLDPTTKEYLGIRGEDYKRLRRDVRVLRQRAGKERITEQVGIGTGPYFLLLIHTHTGESTHGTSAEGKARNGNGEGTIEISYRHPK